MLTKARQILTSELALARDIDKSAASDRLDSILAESAETDDSADDAGTDTRESGDDK